MPRVVVACMSVYGYGTIHSAINLNNLKLHACKRMIYGRTQIQGIH